MTDCRAGNKCAAAGSYSDILNESAKQFTGCLLQVLLCRFHVISDVKNEQKEEKNALFDRINTLALSRECS